MKKLPMTMVLLPLMTVGFTLMASTINVSGGGSALQNAIDNAKAGDVLLVGPGTYSAIDTQGKEIEIRSTKGPKQTFLTCGRFEKSWAKKWGLKGAVWFAALLVSDADTAFWGDDIEDEHFGLGVEWRDWTPMDIVKSRSTLVGFTITSGGAKIPSVADTSGFAVNGGRVFNCIFEGMDETSGCKSMGYVHAAEVCNCLLVARDIGSEIVCDCSVRNCTVVVDSYVGPWDSPVVCCELLNTILWFGQQYEIDNGSYRPRFANVVCRNVKWEEDVDPMFVDIKNGDYALSAGSPCIDAGNNVYSTYDSDLNGGARIVNGTVDIGAYEFGSEYSWIENQDGSVTITKIRDDVSDVLTLPSELGGKPVTAIGPGVLAGDEGDGVVPSIKTLIVPGGLRRIGEDSFSRCPYLAKIVLPKSLEEIGEGAFTAGADSLPFNNYKWKDYENFGVREIKVADGNEYFEVKDGVLFVRVSSAALKAQLFENRFVLVRKLNEAVGAEVIRDCRILG